MTKLNLDAVAELQSRVAELEKDKARLDWLCDVAISISLAGSYPNKSLPCATIPIRKVIDEAMQKEDK